MGLIKAGVGAAGGVLADQWKEFFSCDALDVDTLVMRGTKTVSGRSSNTKGHENVITNGSGIAVADGQCMLIVDQGKIVEVCAEPGEYTYDTSSEPSIFAGDLGESIVESFKTMARRFTFGGDAARDQRVYYVNTKEILDNKFGTANPFMFRVVDHNIKLDREVSVRCNGIYTYRITDPLTFYTNLCSNVTDRYDRSEIDATLKTEFIHALQPAFAELSKLELRPSEIPQHALELEEAMNKALIHKWGKMRGITVASVALNPITLNEEDMRMIQQAQDIAIYRDANLGAAALVGAQAEAMRDAAENPNGAMMGFMGMGMASAAGGGNIMGMYQEGEKQAEAAAQAQAQAETQKAINTQTWNCTCGHVNTGKFCMECGKPKPHTSTWICTCGTENTGKFCMECGAPKPADKSWTCVCGTVNEGKFCMECGKPKPTGTISLTCDTCGWKAEDGTNPPRFCPECGSPFNSSDKQ